MVGKTASFQVYFLTFVLAQKGVDMWHLNKNAVLKINWYEQKQDIKSRVFIYSCPGTEYADDYRWNLATITSNIPRKTLMMRSKIRKIIRHIGESFKIVSQNVIQAVRSVAQIVMGFTDSGCGRGWLTSRISSWSISAAKALRRSSWQGWKILNRYSAKVPARQVWSSSFSM